MAEPETAVADRDTSAGSRADYDAFFSYTTGADARVVRRTERFLEGFHRQWLLRKLRLTALSICVDGSDIRPRFGDTIESVDDTLRRYVARSRHLVVFCSPAAARSPYVDLEIRVFLESHPPGAVLPVVTAGDPGSAADAVFPKALIEREYHKAIWLDFRGASKRWWQRGTQRIRPFKEEQVKLAAELHGRGPDILPAWRKAEVVRRRLTSAAAFSTVVLALAAGGLGLRSYAEQIADDVSTAISEGSGHSIEELHQLAANGVSMWHDRKTDDAYRRAASLTLHHDAAPFSGPRVLSANSAGAARLSNGNLEVTNNVRGGTWPQVLPGPFTMLDISDDGRTVAALGDVGLAVWHDGVASPCVGQPDGADGRAVTVDPTGARIAALFEADRTWSIVVYRAAECGTHPLVAAALWPTTAAEETNGLLRGSPDRAPRVVLNPGGHAVIASSEAGWLLARVGDEPETPLEPLNALLEGILHGDRPDAPTGDFALVVEDEAFSADGRYAAVAAGSVRRGLASRTDPRAVLLPLRDADEPIMIDASRGTHRLSMARTAPLVAYAVDSSVRIWDWSVRARSVVFDVPNAGAVAVAFGATDRLVLVADRAVQQSSLYALDARTGVPLTAVSMRGLVSSVISGGAHGRDTIVTFEDASSGSELVELRPPDVIARLPKGDERLQAGALLSPAGVAVSGGSRTLRIARSGDEAFHAIPLPGQARQLAASIDTVFVLLDGGRLVRCPLADLECHHAADPNPDVRSIVVDSSGALRLGCANGGVVTDSSQCGDASPVMEAGFATALAASTGAVLRMENDRFCVGLEEDSGICETLPTSAERIAGGAISSDGAIVAAAVSTEAGARVDVYERGVQKWLPWPKWGYALQSQIPVRGSILAVSFLGGDAWLRAATVWGREVIVGCFPLTATAISQGSCPDE